MITVVHIITRLELGGAQENTLYTCERLDHRRFRVILMYGPGGELDRRAERMPGVERRPVPELVREIHPRADAAALWHIAQSLRQEQTAHRQRGGDPRRFIVHTHSSKAGVVGRLAAAAVRVPVIVHGIHSYAFHQGQHPAKFALYLGAEHAASAVTDAFVCVAEANLYEGRARGIIRSRHTATVVRSGMELHAFKSSDDRRFEVRRGLDIPDEAEVVLTVANFKPQKDPLTLIEAFATLAAQRPKAILLFAGDGALRPVVEAAIRQHGLSGRVRLLGWRNDVPDLMAACDVVTLSSIFEGLPRSAVQAVAARRPFVGTQVDGTPEVIRPGRNGYLVPPRDPAALARALDDALRHRPVDPEDEARIEAWSVERMVSDQEALYARLVE